MSTSDNKPDPRQPEPEHNPYSEHAAPGNPPQYGQNPPQYGQNPDGGQTPYGYQAPQASGYNYPGNAAEMPAADKGPAPKQVDQAYWLILAAGALYLITAIISQVTAGDMPGMTPTLGIVGLIFNIVLTAVYVLLAVFIRKGHNWARITATVLAAINLVIQIMGLIGLAFLSGMDSEISAGVAFNPLATIMGIIITVLGVAGVVLIWMKPARPYFLPARPAGYGQY